jgi:hypothetical protein
MPDLVGILCSRRAESEIVTTQPTLTYYHIYIYIYIYQPFVVIKHIDPDVGDEGDFLNIDLYINIDQLRRC